MTQGSQRMDEIHRHLTSFKIGIAVGLTEKRDGSQFYLSLGFVCDFGDAGKLIITATNTKIRSLGNMGTDETWGQHFSRGYQRNTTDLDLVIRSEDSDSVRHVFTEAGFFWDSEKAEFRNQNGIAIEFLIAGHKADKGSEVVVSEPIGDLNVERIEGLSVVRLSRLIEMKIARVVTLNAIPFTCQRRQCGPQAQRQCGQVV